MGQTLLRHPKIFTGDPQKPWATALLIDDETVIAAGTAADLGAHGHVDEVVDLPGALVIPGLYDAHIHTANLARDLVSIDLRAATSLPDALATVTAYVAPLPRAAWVFGGRWNLNSWTGGGRPHRLALDQAAPGRKIALASIDGHATWVSSAALHAVGITRDTPDPAGGRIEREEHGEPTGILLETANMPFRRLADDPATVDLPQLLRAAQRELLAVGLTSIHDIDGESCRAAYEQIRAAGDLAIRVHKAVPVDALEQAIAEGRRTGDGDDWFGTGPVKLFADGALGSRTALLSADYNDAPGNRGIPVMGRDELLTLTRRATAAGIAVAAHAIGDAGVRRVLDAYEAVLAEEPLPRTATGEPLRLRVEHAQHLRAGDVQRMARLGVVASMQPTHCTTDYQLVDELLSGHDVVSYPWATLLARGAHLAFGSDAPVEEPNPFHGLHAAVTRQRPDGSPKGGWQPHERLSVADALAAYTVGPAYAAGQDSRKGRLAAGQLADLVCVDQVLLSIEPDQLHDAAPVLTMVGGRVVWEPTAD